MDDGAAKAEGASGDGDRAPRLRALGLGLAVVLLVFHAAFAAQDFVIDDAYISFRYARNLALGKGIVFNPGERVEGYTNFSWVLLSGAWSKVGLDPAIAMRVVGLACGVALLLLVARAAQRLASRAGADARFAGLPAAIVIAASTPLAFYSATGLETALFALLVTGAGLALVEDRPEAFAAWTGAAFLTRPEAALLGALGVAASFGRALSGGRSLRHAFRGCGLLAAVVLPYLAWKLWYFGSLLPNTLAAKPPSARVGLVYVAWLLPEVAGLLLVALTGAFRRGKVTPAGAFAGLWAIHVVAVIFEGGDWMRFGRLLVPWLGFLALAIDARVVELVKDVAARRYRALILIAVAMTYVPLTLLDLTEMADYSDADMVDVYRADFARRIHGAGASSLAAFDIGLVGYVVPSLAIVDLAGLTDREIGRSPGLHDRKRPSPEYLAKRSPDAFLIISKNPYGPGGPDDSLGLDCHRETEQYILGLPWFRASYRHLGVLPIGPTYFIHWFGRAPSGAAPSPG